MMSTARQRITKYLDAREADSASNSTGEIDAVAEWDTGIDAVTGEQVQTLRNIRRLEVDDLRVLAAAPVITKPEPLPLGSVVQELGSFHIWLQVTENTWQRTGKAGRYRMDAIAFPAQVIHQ